ncbi:pentapeptide repeat-containing protein [Streptomyces sp. NPDC058280]|uniref:pentapeptide repeat-containing protein n=1 Tax=Streptomyces sp. NPDC058280 TaxID=3346419 RepID=UPI0036F07570
MQDSEKDRRTVIEVLSAFIREAPAHLVTEEQGEEAEASRQRCAAVQAALVALSRRPSVEEMAFNLEGADLRALNAVHLNLRGAYLARARLDGLRGQGADLRGAYLGRVNLQGADLEDARLENADLRFANLAGVRFGSATLSGVEWSGADLTGATLNAASGLTAEALGRARFTSKTRLPLELENDDRIRRRIEEFDNKQHELDPPQ